MFEGSIHVHQNHATLSPLGLPIVQCQAQTFGLFVGELNITHWHNYIENGGYITWAPQNLQDLSLYKGEVKMSLSPIPRAVSLKFNYEAVRVTSHNIHRKEWVWLHGWILKSSCASKHSYKLADPSTWVTEIATYDVLKAAQASWIAVHARL